MTEFLARLKQRKLVQWAVAYVAFAFALIQVLDVVAQRFGWPDLLERVLILALAVGFFVVLVLAWYHGEKGRQRVSGAELLLIALVLVVGGGLLWYFARGSAQPPTKLATTHVGAKASDVVASAQAALTPPLLAVQSVPAKSVAVLPFVNESGDLGQQYFSDGLSEELITALSQFGGLKVISRDSSFQFRNSAESSAEIGEKLGVAHLLEGSVQRAGGEVRISTELVNAADGSTLWSQQYDRPYKDLFQLQDNITQTVVAALKAKLLDSSGTVAQSDRPSSGNLAAYNAYLQGQFYFQRGSEADMRAALAQFTQATRLDPQYAAAYAEIANVWMRLSGYFLDVANKPHAYAEARAAVQAALRLEPGLVKAHSYMGIIFMNTDLDWSGAQAEYRRALKLAPDNAQARLGLSTIEAMLGHPQTAVALVRQALKRNPLQAFWHDWLASYLGAIGHFDAAEAAARNSVELEPQQPLSYRELTYIEVLSGDAKAALAAAQRTQPGRNRDIAMAWALQISTDHAAADAALQALIAKHAGDSSYQIAEVYALRRDSDNLFKWLDQAWTNRDSGIQYLLYDPIILRYKDDPRFAAFCKKVGLPTTTDAKALP